MMVHVGFSIALFIVIMLFSLGDDASVVGKLFKAATYTYGPLLGMFAFGIISKRKVKDGVEVLLVCVLSPIFCYALNFSMVTWLEFDLGNLILLLNGILTFVGMLMFSVRAEKSKI